METLAATEPPDFLASTAADGLRCAGCPLQKIRTVELDGKVIKLQIVSWTRARCTVAAVPPAAV